MHVLIHEQGTPILKRQLQAEWAENGFSSFKLVGSAKRQVSPTDAAFYVAKYLAKTVQTRQIASKGYGQKSALAAIVKAKPKRDGVSDPAGSGHPLLTRTKGKRELRAINGKWEEVTIYPFEK